MTIILWTLGTYFLVVNIGTFALFGIDKYKASTKKWRISEKKLLLRSAIGGFLGAILGIELFRHKSIKGKFLRKFMTIVGLWVILALVLLFYKG